MLFTRENVTVITSLCIAVCTLFIIGRGAAAYSPDVDWVQMLVLIGLIAAPIGLATTDYLNRWSVAIYLLPGLAFCLGYDPVAIVSPSSGNSLLFGSVIAVFFIVYLIFFFLPHTLERAELRRSLRDSHSSTAY